jgi:hypothetical protein
MSDHEKERQVKARHDGTQFYKQRGVKRITSQQDLPRGDKTISGHPNHANSSSEDDDVEDDIYMTSPQARPQEKGLASASGSGAARDEEEIEEEEGGGNDGAKVMRRRRMKKFLMLRRSTPLLTYTWELQFFGYSSPRIGGRKSAIRAKQI